MEYVDKSKQIKKALLKGGLVVAARASGKTKALAEILAEDNDAVVIVGQQVQAIRLRNWLMVAYAFTKDELKGRILVSPYDVEKHRLSIDFLEKHAYVDEYHLNPYKGPFKAAVTSFPYEVKVIK
jgi:hypothetical protein